MKKIIRGLFISFSTALLLCSFPTKAQTTDTELSATILHLDSLFWNAYNNCDSAGMRKYLAADLEFYHDKGGVMQGANAVITTSAKNLCKPGFKIRRVALPATIKTYSMRDGDTIYGAVIEGEHYFYVTENRQPEQRVGLARFNHLWLKQADGWKMSRILSFDHKAAEPE